MKNLLLSKSNPLILFILPDFNISGFNVSFLLYILTLFLFFDVEYFSVKGIFIQYKISYFVQNLDV